MNAGHDLNSFEVASNENQSVKTLKLSLLLFSFGFRKELFRVSFESCSNNNSLWFFSLSLSGIIRLRSISGFFWACRQLYLNELTWIFHLITFKSDEASNFIYFVS